MATTTKAAPRACTCHRKGGYDPDCPVHGHGAKPLAQQTIGDPIHTITVSLDLTGITHLYDGENRLDLQFPVDPSPELHAKAAALAREAVPDSNTQGRLIDAILDVVLRVQSERAILERIVRP